MTILLTGTRAPATLDLARRLACGGHRVVGADSMHFPLGRWSKAFVSHHFLPPPRQAPEAFLAALQGIIASEKVELLWPTCEEVFHVARFHAALSESCRLMCPPLETLRPLHHKLEFTGIVQAAGTRVQAPASWPAEAAPPQERLVWKPCFSRFASRTRFDSPPVDCAGWMAQQFIAGSEFCSWACCQDGVVRVMSMYENQARAGRGAGCSFSPYWSEEAAAFAVKLAERTAFTGVLAFDFIRTVDGQVFVLECNPRMTSGIHVLAEDLDWVSLLAQGSAERPAMQPAQLALPVLFSKPSLLGRAPDVIWRSGDPAPFWTQFLCAGEFVLRALRSRISLLAATTEDIEYNG
jgi:hypothetical protein